jgi:ParB-like chromosome segregation protein Spo0J
MKTEKVAIAKIKSNEKNPRYIRDEKFKKLVKSIQDFPQMLEIRPIVVNKDMVVLGGNMRLKACQEAGLKEVYIIKAENLTKEQQDEFIIKDNVGFGEWDFDILANEWDLDKINEWGVDAPFFENENEFSTTVGKELIKEKNAVVVIDIFNNNVIEDIKNDLSKYLESEIKFYIR